MTWASGRVGRSLSNFGSPWSLLFVVSLLAFSIHLLPLSISPYPFNNDGLTEVYIADRIIETGHVSIPNPSHFATTHSQSTPVFDTMLAFVSTVVGADPMFASQWMIAAISPLVAVTTYAMLMMFCGDRRASLAGAFFATMFGTFVYLTASVWKESLGMCLYVLLVYAYSNRQDKRMNILAIIIMFTIPFVHHLVAVVSYMTIAYLVGWSWVVALRNGAPRKRHYHDLIIVIVVVFAALAYYISVSFDRLSYVDSMTSFILIAASMLLFFLPMIVVLSMKSHSKWTFAPVPAAIVLTIAYLDYSGWFFSYKPSAPWMYYSILMIASAVMIAFAWYGMEVIIESRSRYRAIPMGMLLPAATLIFFAIVSPSVTNKQQMIYRSFDFADPALGLGIGIAFFAILRAPKLKDYAKPLLAAFIALLFVSLPFGINTTGLLGLRHDTQAFEVDALEWLVSSENGTTLVVQNDERMSYIGTALFGIGKNNKLPYILDRNASLSPGTHYVYEEIWSTQGVNDFPRGLIKPSTTFMSMLFDAENVTYIGGGFGNRLFIFSPSFIGQTHYNWYGSPADYAVT